jgi:hypothetical protein
MSVFYMSFADDKRGGFQGALVIEAPTFERALYASHALAINPGGQVYTVEHNTPADIAAIELLIPREKWYRLLSKADIPNPVGLDGKPR